ncbi:MAG: hypothetical protein Q8M07_21225 [Prosthecobacter sp.]|nr:hypothetical protein [Prosthecobacter sp.]
MVSSIIEPASPPHPLLWSQEFINALALARHREIARMIEANVSILGTARANAERWLASGNYDEGEAASVREWLPMLEESRLDELMEVLTSESETATRMRQSSPFTGIIPKAAYRNLRDNLIQEWSQHAA